MKQFVLVLLIMTLGAAGCTSATATPAQLTHLRVPMGYIANVQYAPFYVAVSKGYFAQEGIEIEFDYRPEIDGMKLVGAGELPFAVVSGEQVPLARANGLPVVYVLQWFQKFPVVVVSPADKNIKTPNDLIGKSVGLPALFGASYIGWRGLLYKANIQESEVKAQDVGYAQVSALQQGTVDAIVAYINNEPIQLRAAGMNINVIDVNDSVPMVSNGIVTNEKTIKEKPELVRGFVRALLHGIQDTIANPDAAFQICTQYVDKLGTDPKSDNIQRQVLAESIKLWVGATGRSSPAAWDTTQAVLLSMGLIKSKLDNATLFTNQFVDETK